MILKNTNRFAKSSQSFNMTPIIDIVFLLIIFFLVVCKFIEAENFPVTVPDGCQNAQEEKQSGVQVTTVTVMKSADGQVVFAVGSEKVTASSGGAIIARVAELIDELLDGQPIANRVVTLRIDRDVCFDQAQYALAAVAESSATDIKLAAVTDKHAESD